MMLYPVGETGYKNSPKTISFVASLFFLETLCCYIVL